MGAVNLSAIFLRKRNDQISCLIFRVSFRINIRVLCDDPGQTFHNRFWNFLTLKIAPYPEDANHVLSSSALLIFTLHQLHALLITAPELKYSWLREGASLLCKSGVH